jgi:hypothetical protein
MADEYSMAEIAVISIKGIDKPTLLAALYNASIPRETKEYDPATMSVAEARLMLARSNKFGKVNGRMLHITLDGTSLRTVQYDMANGAGAAAAIVDSLYLGLGPDSIVTQTIHQCGLLAARGGE